jgi:hypothetical protein
MAAGCFWGKCKTAPAVYQLACSPLIPVAVHSLLRISLGRVGRETAKRKAEELAAALRVNRRIEGPELAGGLLFDS